MALVNILNGPEEEHTLFNADISWPLSNFEATQNWIFTVIFDFDVETATENGQTLVEELATQKKKRCQIYESSYFLVEISPWFESNILFWPSFVNALGFPIC